VLIAGVIEGRRTLHPEVHRSANHFDPADELVASVTVLGYMYRHIVRDLPHAIGTEEAGDQDVGVGPVELFAGYTLRNRCDPEASALSIIEDGSEDARGVEVRQSQPVDRAVYTNQSHAVQIPDDPVVLYRLVGHGVFSLPLRVAYRAEVGSTSFERGHLQVACGGNGSPRRAGRVSGCEMPRTRLCP
jgi:hypothetical protein